MAKAIGNTTLGDQQKDILKKENAYGIISGCVMVYPH
jgi:hypothetical protein